MSQRDRLENTKWRLQSQRQAGSAMPVVGDSVITIEFSSDGRVRGFGGCNSFGGAYEIRDDNIRFSQIVSTKMACANTEVMQQESLFLEALQSSEQFELEDEGLVLRADSGRKVLTFAKADS